MTTTEEQLAELTALLEKAFGHDPASLFPEDPYAFDPTELKTWRDVAAVVAAYPKGLPPASKNAVLDFCRDLTQEGHANPDLTVRVARMPVFGAHTTRAARRVVQPGLRRRSGLTRTGGGMMMRHTRKAEQILPAPMDVGTQDPSTDGLQSTPPSADRIQTLERMARGTQRLLEHEPTPGPAREALLQRTRAAWDSLLQALEQRLAHLKKDGAPAPAQAAYRDALSQVRDIITGLR